MLDLKGIKWNNTYNQFSYVETGNKNPKERNETFNSKNGMKLTNNSLPNPHLETSSFPSAKTSTLNPAQQIPFRAPKKKSHPTPSNAMSHSKNWQSDSLDPLRRHLTPPQLQTHIRASHLMQLDKSAPSRIERKQTRYFPHDSPLSREKVL